MITVKGLCGISATVVCDSISEAGIRLTTFEIEYPRIILSELNTHRMLSKNSSSSRAIPFAKMQEQLTGKPVSFGKNQSGMQAGGEHDTLINDLYTPQEWWGLAQLSAKKFSQGYAEAGYHKQVCNRLTEPFQMMKTVISATEFSNFFWLRKHGAADPTIEALAQAMWEAYNESVPQVLKAGWYHLPYVASLPDKFTGRPIFYIADSEGRLSEWLTIDEAIKVSCARCCAVSFRNTDYGLEKSLEVYERLVGDERKHGSALEHCCTPVSSPTTAYADCDCTDYSRSINLCLAPRTWEQGISHVDRVGQLWSGNMKGWIQHRKLIVGENHSQM